MPTFTGETGARIREMEARLAALEAGGGGSRIVFSAYREAGLVIPTNSSAWISMDVKEYDPENAFKLAASGSLPAGRFQPNIAGYYRLSTAVGISTELTNTDYLWLSMYGRYYYPGIGYHGRPLMNVPTMANNKNGVAGTIIVKAGGYIPGQSTDYFIPTLSHSLPTSIALETHSVMPFSRTYFQGEWIAPIAAT
jgi:hypothetical protein